MHVAVAVEDVVDDLEEKPELGRERAPGAVLGLALSCGADVARELIDATLAMIGGQQQDLEGGHDLASLHRLKTGALFTASIMCGVRSAGVPEGGHGPWRTFAAELGLLFQVVDDILDGDGYVVEVGETRARQLADDAAARADSRLAAIPADTSVLAEMVAMLAARTS